MKVYATIAACSALGLSVLMLGNLDAQLPYYGLEAFRASDGWKWVQVLGAGIALPFLLLASLVLSIVGAVVSRLTVNQPHNQPNQLVQPTNQPAQLNQPTDTTEAGWDGRIDRPQEAFSIPMLEPPEPGDLSHAIKKAVWTTADCQGDMAAAAEVLGVGYEAVRKSVATARKSYPDWTNFHIPPKGR
jgi:Na+-transporting methylmalonyl-CoA/oxaloacetate decarboxylase gamma subunit